MTFYYKPDLCAGSFRATSLVEELKISLNSNDEVTILTTLPNRYSTYTQKAREQEIDGNVRIVRFHLSNHKSGFVDQAKAFCGYFKQVLKYIKTENYDIVFATSSRLCTAFLGAIVSRRKGSILLLDIRDIFKDTLKSILNPFIYLILKFPLTLVEKYTFQMASKINLVSEGFIDYFKSRFPNAKYTFYYNGIDEEFYNYNFEKKADNKKIITYAGNIGQGQGLETIIPDLALYLGEDYEIRIIGDGGRKKSLVEKIKSNDIRNVKIIGPVKRDKLLVFYKESDYLFLHLNNVPAFKKVLPSKIFEYAITNKVILAGVDGFALKFLQENLSNLILFKPGSIESFKKCFNSRIEQKSLSNDFLIKFRRKNIMKEMVKEYFIQVK